MANKENNQSVEFTGVVVGEKVYFVSKAKAMEFVDGISVNKKEEKILNSLDADEIRDAIDKTGVKNPKKLDCAKLARKILGKKYEKLSDDVQGLVRGVISAVANGAVSVSAAKAAYDDVKNTIDKVGEMYDELKEKNEKLIDQVGKEKVEETEHKVSDAESKAIKKSLKEMIDELDFNNLDASLESSLKNIESTVEKVKAEADKNGAAKKENVADEYDNIPAVRKFRAIIAECVK